MEQGEDSFVVELLNAQEKHGDGLPGGVDTKHDDGRWAKHYSSA